MKNFLTKMWAFITGLWSKLDKIVDKYAPISYNVVNAIKTINESSVGDIIELIITRAIPGDADDVVVKLLRKQLKAILPKILLQMKIIQSIANIQDPNEQIKAICIAVNMSPDSTQNAYYHSWSALIFEALADKKVTWSESVHIMQYYFDNIYKK